MARCSLSHYGSTKKRRWIRHSDLSRNKARTGAHARRNRSEPLGIEAGPHNTRRSAGMRAQAIRQSPARGDIGPVVQRRLPARSFPPTRTEFAATLFKAVLSVNSLPNSRTRQRKLGVAKRRIATGSQSSQRVWSCLTRCLTARLADHSKPTGTNAESAEVANDQSIALMRQLKSLFSRDWRSNAIQNKGGTRKQHFGTALPQDRGAGAGRSFNRN